MYYIKSKLFYAQIVIQIVLVVAFVTFGYSTLFQAVASGVLLCTVGIPHGANDHLYRKDQSFFGLIKFLATYLGIIVLYLVLWWVLPILALVIFFLFSFHHFGQSNFDNDKISYLPSILWGIILLAFPLVIHFDEAMLIFKSMVGLGNFNEVIVDVYHQQLSTWQIAFLLILLVIYLLSIYKYQKKYFLNYTLQFFLIAIWYFVTPLLFGFIIVFCLWHSLQSIRHQTIFYSSHFRKNGFYFLKAMIPFSVISIIGFAAYIYFFSFNIGKSFILLALISLPHILIMHKLYIKDNHGLILHDKSES